MPTKLTAKKSVTKKPNLETRKSMEQVRNMWGKTQTAAASFKSLDKTAKSINPVAKELMQNAAKLNSIIAVDTANPKDAAGRAKVPLSLVPFILKMETSLAYLEGKLKYGEVNWRETPVYASVYIDAAMRHWEAFTEGQDRDPATKVHHLGNATACAGIILDAQHYGTLIDDRKMSNGNVLHFMEALKRTVAHVTELYKDKNPKHFKIQDTLNTGITFAGSKGREQDLG